MVRSLNRSALRGTTIPEIAVSVLLVGIFFASIFEVNAVCLRYIEASKESVGVLQGVHDRLETLRNLAFTDLTAQSYMTTLLTSAADTSPFSSRAAEVVTLTDVTSLINPAHTGPAVTYTRGAGASVTPTVSWSGGTSFPLTGTDPTRLVKVNVSYTWTMTFGGRQRMEQTETIVADGPRK